MYDLTSLLITIAGSSATMTAIVGGFIASKLIALNAEREELTTRILEIDQEIGFRTKAVDNAHHELMEDDALDFILDHIEDVILGKALETVYIVAERPKLSHDELAPFWEKTLKVIRDLIECMNDENHYMHLNDDGIPNNFAAELEDFEYTVCEYAVRRIQRARERHAIKKPSPFNFELGHYDFELPRITGQWYQNVRDGMNVQIGQIEWLQAQKKQLQTRKGALKKPKGMVSGLVVFLILVLVGIVAPLVAVPYSTENYACYVALKCIYIALFLVGLLLVVLYFVSLLRWKEPR